MKKIFGLLLVLLIIVVSVGCSKTSDDVVEVYANFKEVNSLNEAEQIIGFGINIDEDLFGDEYEKRIRVMEPKLIEVHYNQLDEWIIIRKALYKDEQDISGDYNEYPQKDTNIIDYIQFSTRGSDGMINVVSWRSGDYSYSLNINPGGVGFDKEKTFNIVSKIN